MSRGLRVGGHPLHAALSDFPLVLFLLWVALDAVALGGGAPLFWMLGHWALIAGLVAAGAAATAGFIDYLAVGATAGQQLAEAVPGAAARSLPSPFRLSLPFSLPSAPPALFQGGRGMEAARRRDCLGAERRQANLETERAARRQRCGGPAVGRWRARSGGRGGGKAWQGAAACSPPAEADIFLFFLFFYFFG